MAWKKGEAVGGWSGRRGKGVIKPGCQGLCYPRCPKARHLGHPSFVVVLTSPGARATRLPELQPNQFSLPGSTLKLRRKQDVKPAWIGLPD
jgi:hypothetical protein